MERKLYIIRHGKSNWSNEGLDDIDRPLAGRGTRDAGEMAQRLLEKRLVPEMIFTSPACRAFNTALIMARAWNLDPSSLQVHDELYMAYPEEIGEVVARAPETLKSLAIFGHNPSFTLYANTFLEYPLDNLPTAGVVVVTLESDTWKGIGRAHVKKTHVDIPKKTGR
jgi:phosphohistidine phosphatase